MRRLDAEPADMSDRVVECENCKKLGRRPWFHPCPKGWLYLTTTLNDDITNPIFVRVCSKACADARWQEGPGPNLND